MASNTPPDAKALSKSVNVAVARAIKSANGLPKIGDNFELVASYPAFSQLMDAERVRMIELLKRLLRHGNCKTKIPSPIRDNDEFFDRLIEANDSILERVGNLLDEAEGIRKPEDVAVPVSTEDFAESTTASSKTQFKIPLTQSRKAGQQRKAVATLPSASGSKILKKPQVQYSIPVDNSAAPFVPKLKIKHHSRPRKSGNVTIADDTNSGREWLSDENESMHPYQYELDYYEPPAAQLELGTITDPLPVEETPLVYVDNVEKLTELRDILNKEKEFAVDVEHHDYRSFLGLTCLVQISTRTVDYIIDPFPIWQHMHILNEPFVDPKILKVFHGANKDMEWLQRDFGIYVVNMFDTGRAMRLLQFPKFSLQYLVQLYCNESLNKEYQLTDWRIRPLPSDYQTYARCDTHYLLFCYDKLRQRLLESSNERKNLISAVYTASREICLTVYSKPQFDADGYDRFVTIRKSLNNRQLFALKELWRWRDETARTNDESRAYILPDHMLLQIAEALPREMQGILACCNPIPALVKTSLHELHRIILAARERPLEAKMTLTKNPPTLPTDARRSSLAWLNTPHDHSFSKIDEEIRPLARGDESRLEAVVEKQYSRLLNLMDTICKEQPSIHLFASAVDTAKQAASPTKGTSSNKGTSLKQATSLKRSFADWASPYDCYRVAVTKREEEELKKRAAVSEQTAKKSKWSHHDPSSGRGSKPREIRSTPIEDSSETAKETAEVTIGIDEEMTLTDRALRKRRKNEKGTTDVAFNLKETLAEPSQMKKGKWSDETRHANIQPVDYSNFASDIFNQKPSKAGTFDPHRTSSVRRGRGGRRGGRRGGGGGLDRARPKTQSFGGRNK